MKAPGIAPQSAAADGAGEEHQRDQDDRREVRQRERDRRRERAPPIAIWPSPPMLKTLARNAMQIPTPTSSSGTAFTAVALRA